MQPTIFSKKLRKQTYYIDFFSKFAGQKVLVKQKMNFKLSSAYQPTGDQPEAIQQLTDGLLRGDKAQVLLGVTGSGKTCLLSYFASSLPPYGRSLCFSYQYHICAANNFAIPNSIFWKMFSLISVFFILWDSLHVSTKSSRIESIFSEAQRYVPFS